MFYCIAILMGYLLGCSNMALYLAKARGVDLREGGSGNLGASNAAILLGWRAAVLVALHDIGKAVLAVILARVLFPETEFIGVVAGVAAVLGHMFPVFMKFRGGKGFASYLGMTLALNWKFALIILAMVVIVTLITDYIVVGTVTTVVAVPVALGLFSQSVILPVILCVATGVILYKHRENYVRIWKGTEIGLSSAFKGKHRVK